jgi:hypothetical protein
MRNLVRRHKCEVTYKKFHIDTILVIITVIIIIIIIIIIIGRRKIIICNILTVAINNKKFWEELIAYFP